MTFPHLRVFCFNIVEVRGDIDNFPKVDFFSINLRVLNSVNFLLACILFGILVRNITAFLCFFPWFHDVLNISFETSTRPSWGRFDFPYCGWWLTLLLYLSWICFPSAFGYYPFIHPMNFWAYVIADLGETSHILSCFPTWWSTFCISVVSLFVYFGIPCAPYISSVAVIYTSLSLRR